MTEPLLKEVMVARVKSPEKREAIVAGAIAAIAESGVRATTTVIAARAGVSHGSLFNYFPSKEALFNEVYADIKAELVRSVGRDIPESGDVEKRAEHVWQRWTDWGLSNPQKQAALAQLAISDVVTQQTRERVLEASEVLLTAIGKYSEPSSRDHHANLFSCSLIDSVVEATIKFLIKDPARADDYRKIGFNAYLRLIRQAV